MPVSDEYLGDGVYASFDGYHIVLDLRGQDEFTCIALEPSVLRNLDAYRKQVDQAVLTKRETKPTNKTIAQKVRRETQEQFK